MVFIIEIINTVIIIIHAGLLSVSTLLSIKFFRIYPDGPQAKNLLTQKSPRRVKFRGWPISSNKK